MYKSLSGILILLLFFVLIFSSCRTNILLGDVEGSVNVKDTVTEKVLKYEHRLRPDDKIMISFWNHPELSNGNIYNPIPTQVLDENRALLIDKDGFTSLPMLGRKKLSGMTVAEAARSLEKMYASFYKDPIITINVINLRVSVLGEVNRPGMVTLKKEQTSLLEAVSEAGDFTIDAKKARVKIIRGDLNDPEIITVDLTTLDAMKNSELILRADDIVYVEPLRRKFSSRTTQDILPYVSIASSLANVFYLLFFLSNNN